MQRSGYNLKLELKNELRGRTILPGCCFCEEILIDRRTCGDLLMTRDRLNVGNQRRTPFQSAQAKGITELSKLSKGVTPCRTNPTSTFSNTEYMGPAGNVRDATKPPTLLHSWELVLVEEYVYHV